MEQGNYQTKDLLIQDVETATSNPTQNNNNTTTNRSQIEEPKIILYKRRFLALILFSLCTSINSCGWICFAPIGDVLQKNYGVSIFIINYLSQIYMIMYLPLNFPSVYALDKLGLRWGVLIGIALTALGLWVRCLINHSFAWVIVGQTILAIAYILQIYNRKASKVYDYNKTQPFTYNAPAKLSANWFGEKERVYATSFGANASTFGIAAGFFLPSVFISDEITQTEDFVRQQTFWLLMTVSIAGSVILLISLIDYCIVFIFKVCSWLYSYYKISLQHVQLYHNR